MGTVRTLLATSSEESFEQLQTCIRGANSYGIVVPQAHFLEQFLRFYPEFPRERLYTPSTLLNACGLKPVSPEIALLSEHFDEFDDPSLLEFKDETFKAWLSQQSYAFWNFDLEVKVPFERCILFGSFSHEQKQHLVNALRCREYFVLQRTFSKSAPKDEETNLHVHRYETIAAGYAWVERMKTEHPNTCGILLPNAKEWTTLFRKPPPKQALAWLDWQEEGIVGSFLAYVQTTVDFKTLEAWQKDCDEAFRDCLTEHFETLREHLLQEGKTWIEPFECCDWSASDTVGNYTTLLQNIHPPSEFLNLSVLQTCPFVVTKRAFFSYLRRLLQYRSGFEADVLRWDEAAFLPIKDGFIPQAVSTGSGTDADVLAWMDEVSRRGGVLRLGVPFRDRNGDPLQPLAEKQTPSELIGTEDPLSAERVVSKELSTGTRADSHFAQTIETTTDGRTYITVSNALSIAADTCGKRSKANILRFPNFEKSKKSSDADSSVPSLIPKNALRIPKEFIRFSCKTWERFYRCPRKTWLEKILKTVSVPLYPTVSKALFWGESIHDNLIFARQPRDLDEWQASIRQRSDVRWQHLCRYNGSNASLLRQRHQRALEFSLKMAEACEEFLHDGWHLCSEHILPKESLYTGRMDLLAVHEGKQKVVIVDYKSGFNENFTPRTLKSGYGWQLLLYGRAVQTLYPTYAVELRMVLRTGETKLLRLDEVDDAVSQMNAWIEAVRQSGLYEELPDENAETLPLAFVGGKIRRY